MEFFRMRNFILPSLYICLFYLFILNIFRNGFSSFSMCYNISYFWNYLFRPVPNKLQYRVDPGKVGASPVLPAFVQKKV